MVQTQADKPGLRERDVKKCPNTLPKNPCSSAKIEKGISIVKDLSQLYGTVILKTTFPKRTEWRW